MKRASEGGIEPPSKSELKRRSREIEVLGEALIDLDEARLAALPLPDDLRAAVDTARRITSHGARVRQRQYVGKLMRRMDVEPIREALEQVAAEDRRRIRREHELERWRERLVADEAGAWSELGGRAGPEDLEKLAGLARQARAERAAGGAGTAGRQLFRRLRELLGSGED